MEINTTHNPKEQFKFKEKNQILLQNFRLYRDNKFTKIMINNRHDIKMSKHNNAGYGYQIFYGTTNVGSIWLLNQINSKTTYVRVSRYESYQKGYFIALLSELSDMLESEGYSLLLKTGIKFAQDILDKNFECKFSKASNSKRGKNDRSTKNVSVDGNTYYINCKKETYNKWHKEKFIFDA